MKLIINDKDHPDLCEIPIEEVEIPVLPWEMKENFINFLKPQLPTLENYIIINIYFEDNDIDEEYLSNYFSTIESKNIIIKLASNKEIMIPFDEFSHILKSERSKVSFVIFKCKEDTK